MERRAAVGVCLSDVQREYTELHLSFSSPPESTGLARPLFVMDILPKAPIDKVNQLGLK